MHLLSSQEVRADDSASEELLTFHEAVLNLREAEDALVEHHKEIVEESERWLAADRQLVALAEGTESNTDGVCAVGRVCAGVHNSKTAKGVLAGVGVWCG